MTIGECIAITDRLKPNAYNEADKVKWLSTLDSQISKVLLKSDEIYSYDFGTDSGGSLLAASPFDNIYPLYLYAMIDYYNQELSLYNISIKMFDEAFLIYKKYVSETIGKRSKFINYW